jgi:NAD(P)H-flavin reductase
VPQTAKVAGIVAEIGKLSPEVIEVAVALQSPLQYRPGQYVRAKFAGFPAREYSPTCRLDGSFDPNELIFHIRRLPGGLISSQLGATTPRTGAWAFRACLPARGRRPAGAGGRRDRLGADLVVGARGAP